MLILINLLEKQVNNVGFITRKDGLPVYADIERADDLLPRSIKAHVASSNALAFVTRHLNG